MGNIAPVIAAAIDSHEYLSPPRDIRRFLNTKNSCEACHRGLQESNAVSGAEFPQMADCLVCHAKLEKIDPPFSCTTCHAKDFRLMPANHDAQWLDFHASGKSNMDKQTCASLPWHEIYLPRLPLMQTAEVLPEETSRHARLTSAVTPVLSNQHR